MRPILLIALLLTSVSHAQWSTDPANNLLVGYGITPEVGSDSSGGCYITYIQQVGIYDRILLERLNRYGYKPWGTYRQIVGALPGQTFAKITEDGRGGVIVSFVDVELISPKEPPIQRLRLQRVDSSGNFLWGPNGVRVSVSETNQGDQAIVSDGDGGCIVAWRDTVNTLRIQRVDLAGTRVWGDTGRYLYDDGGGAPVMTTDQASGAIMSWRYQKLQRINARGDKVLSDTGITIAGGAGQLAIDHNALVYARGRRILGIQNGELLFTLTLHQLDTLGTLHWDSLGTVLDTINTNLSISTYFAVRGGYSTVAWPQHVNSTWDLRTQIVRSDGSIVFPQGGLPVSQVLSQKWIIGVLPSDSMTSIYVWDDYRTTGGTYAQRLDTTGGRLWDTTDVVLSSSRPSKVVTDGNGGFIAIVGGQNFAVRAQQVNKYGQLGQVITSIEGQPDTYIPLQAILYQNYPNPFNPQTTIRFQLPRAAPISLTLYNILGQNVMTLASGVQMAGVHSVVLEAGDLPSGTYYYRLTTPEAVLTHKILIIK